MEFEENNQTQDASFPEKPNETPAQDMPGAEAEESSRQPDAQARREKQYETFTMLHDLVYILAAITLVFVFLFRLVGVKGSSMYPTLFDHDYLVLESNFLYRTVRQGDIVVIDPPQQAQLDGSIVKRVIATGGQTVDIDFEKGIVYVDGVALNEEYTAELTLTQEDFSGPITVPEGCLFFLGDNRSGSNDARYWEESYIPVGNVKAHVLLAISLTGGSSWQGVRAIG